MKTILGGRSHDKMTRQETAVDITTVVGAASVKANVKYHFIIRLVPLFLLQNTWHIEA